MNEVNRDLGALVREYRQELDLTQLDLAVKLGYDSTQFVSLFERGLSKIPFNVIGKLIVILGIPERKIMKVLTAAFESDLRERINEGKKDIAG